MATRRGLLAFAVLLAAAAQQALAARMTTAAASAAESMLPALMELGELLDTDGPSSGRALLATTTTTQRRVASRVNLLASDGFSLVYTAGNVARAAFALMQPMVAAGQSGMVSLDAMSLLNLSQLLASMTATVGDLLSKSARLSADGIAPV